MDLLISLSIVILSVLIIGKGSDWLTDSLIPLARKLGVTGSFVGLILVSVAVSLPEILVAVYATLKGYPAIGLGVVLGSIVCNIGLMTGLSALVHPLKVSTHIILRDGIFSIVVPILVFAVIAGGELTRLEGFAFLLLFFSYVINVYLHEIQRTQEEKIERMKEVEIELNLAGFDFGKLRPGWFSFGLGLSFLLFGAQLFGNQLIQIAQSFSINEVFIGLTLGALGPSIPNIIAAYQATKRGMGEIAVSETLGSNIFTLLVTLGIVAMLSPIRITSQWLQFDLPAMLFMSILLFIFMITKKTITKTEGLVLLGGYLVIIIAQVFVYVL